MPVPWATERVRRAGMVGPRQTRGEYEVSPCAGGYRDTTAAERGDAALASHWLRSRP